MLINREPGSFSLSPSSGSRHCCSQPQGAWSWAGWLTGNHQAAVSHSCPGNQPAPAHELPLQELLDTSSGFAACCPCPAAWKSPAFLCHRGDASAWEQNSTAGFEGDRLGGFPGCSTPQPSRCTANFSLSSSGTSASLSLLFHSLCLLDPLPATGHLPACQELRRRQAAWDFPVLPHDS